MGRPKHLIQLTYFKRSGEYYTEGCYYTEQERMDLVSDEVKDMKSEGPLPGLIQGCGKDFIIHITSDNLPNAYPILLIPDNNEDL